tara:strand:+ start:364 stop:744 length:381 start_codon:yes stop_codon:yes gene_type:complete
MACKQQPAEITGCSGAEISSFSAKPSRDVVIRLFFVTASAKSEVSRKRAHYHFTENSGPKVREISQRLASNRPVIGPTCLPRGLEPRAGVSTMRPLNSNMLAFCSKARGTSVAARLGAKEGKKKFG